MLIAKVRCSPLEVSQNIISKILIYIHIAQTLEQNFNLSSSAIAYYKKAINSIEEVRAQNIDLSPELKAIFLGKADGAIGWSDIYVSLATRLLEKERVVEALLVLDLLKAQELQDFFADKSSEERLVKCISQSNTKSTQCIEITPDEEQVLKLFSSDHYFKHHAQIQQLEQKLTQTAPDQNLQLTAYYDLQTRLSKLGKHSALFYPLILKDHLELVLFTHRGTPIHKHITLTKAELEWVVNDFRLQMPKENSQVIRQPAKQLYEWLISPIAADLKRAKIKTIIYAPDGALRYVPLAALYDGKQWLVENYQINYITALGLTNLSPQSFQQPKILAGAFTDSHRLITVGEQTLQFSHLPYASREVEFLEQTFENTTTLLGSDFTRSNMIPTRLNRYNIIHLATHGQLVSDNPEESFILLNNGEHITLREIKDWQLPNVGLVVLSACQTALGNRLGSGIEVIGFGYQLQLAQARASIATLWQINDATTSDLMDTFYDRLKQGSPNPVHALRAAQIDLIRGQGQGAKGEGRTSVVFEPGQGGSRDGISRDRSHPYYWAPFILIGNGL